MSDSSEVEMKTHRLLITLLGTAISANAVAATTPGVPPPPLVGGSDTCMTPDTITGAGPFAFDTTVATTGIEGQTNTRCFIYNTSAISFDVWFQWTAPSTGWVQVNLCNFAFNDTKVAVYTGLGCPTAEPVVCDDDGCGTLGSRSRAPFLATQGQIYTIQLGSYPGTAGATGSFTIDPFTPGAGDDCHAPIALTGTGPFVWDDTNTTTGFEGQMEVLCNSQMITYDSWYTWTANCSGPVTITLCGLPGPDTKMAVYAGAGCPSGSALACDDDFCGAGNTSQVTINATSGNTYTIQIGMWPGWLPSIGQFDIQTPCPPMTGTPYCFGDGTGTACPCGNNGAPGHGCASSVNPNGALLGAIGQSALANDTLTLQGSGMPNSSCLYFQGTTQISSVFGDGLRCAGGTVNRLGTKTNVNGSSQYPAPGDQSVSVRGAVTSPGTRSYQVWYRNAAAFCTPSTFNLTNGLSIVWS
jgi:hypothetical protein